MIVDRKMNLQQFFEHGYAVTHIEKDFADLMLHEMREGEWRKKEPMTFGPSSPDIISWSNQEAPVNIDAFWRVLATDSYFSYLVTHAGAFSKFKPTAHRWGAGHGLLVHQDYHESLPINNILYLSGDEWDDQEGGDLKIGRWKIDSNGFGDPETAEPIAEIYPVHGTLVTLYNGNPLFCHSVSEMKLPREKYSLICRYGYEENYKGGLLNGRM